MRIIAVKVGAGEGSIVYLLKLFKNDNGLHGNHEEIVDRFEEKKGIIVAHQGQCVIEIYRPTLVKRKQPLGDNS